MSPASPSDPERPGSWNHGALKAREAFSKIALTIAEHEQLFMMVSDEAYESANKMIGFHNNVQLVRMKTDDAWARDTGATFVVSADERRAIDWQFNAWGGQYDGLYASWDNDQLVAARIAGVDRIYKVGGAQAIAALAFGTGSVPKVDKIVGPGNIFVALAKKAVFGHVSIDSVAGPSEILVIADDSADPSYVAADLFPRPSMMNLQVRYS